MGPQTDLFTAAPAAVADRRAAGTPQAFRYQDDIVTPSEEQALVAEITTLDLKPFEFRGYLGLRRVRAFGYRYDYVRRVVDVVEPIPAFLQALTGRVAAVAGRSAEAFRQVLVTEYAPGRRSDGIGTSRSSATSSASHCCRHASSACGIVTARGGTGHPSCLNPARPT